MSVFPTTADNIYSAFHIRDDVRRFLQVRSQEDVGISHDWPGGIELCGDHEKLSRKKQGSREDCNIGKLGSIAAQKVLGQLRPA
jgi:lariat debranching enzyme